MSGFYLIGVIAVWLWLTRLLWKGGRRVLNVQFAPPAVRIGVVVLGTVLSYAVSGFQDNDQSQQLGNPTPQLLYNQKTNQRYIRVLDLATRKVTDIIPPTIIENITLR